MEATEKKVANNDLEVMTISDTQKMIIGLLQSYEKLYHPNNPAHNILRQNIGNENDFVTYLEQRKYEAIRNLPAFFIWGDPGVGKSDMIEQIARTLNRPLIDIRLTTMEPIDLRGLPMIDKENAEAKWLQPSFMPKSDVLNGILFIDEINAVNQNMQASTYQLLLKKKIGEYDLPPGWIVICAGNKMGSKAVTHRLPTPVANRCVHIEIKANTKEWIKWAQKNNIDSLIVNFIKSGISPRVSDDQQHNSLFTFDPARNDTAFTSPRSWAFVSMFRYLRDIDMSLYIPIVKGAVGQYTGSLFIEFINNAHHLPNPEDLLEGRDFNMPAQHHLMYVVVGMVNQALIDNFTTERFNNALDLFYAQFIGHNKIDIAAIGLQELGMRLNDDILLKSEKFLRLMNELIDDDYFDI